MVTSVCPKAILSIRYPRCPHVSLVCHDAPNPFFPLDIWLPQYAQKPYLVTAVCKKTIRYTWLPQYAPNPFFPLDIHDVHTCPLYAAMSFVCNKPILSIRNPRCPQYAPNPFIPLDIRDVCMCPSYATMHQYVTKPGYLNMDLIWLPQYEPMSLHMKQTHSFH